MTDFANEILFFCIRASSGQDFTFTKEIEHGGLTDGSSLPGRDNGSEFQTGQTFGGEVGIDLEQDERFTDIFGILFGAIPPIDPAKDLGNRIRQRQGQRHQDAILTSLTEFNGISSFTDTFGVFQHS